MNRRKTLYLLTLLAAGGGPYVYFSEATTTVRQKLDATVSSFSGSGATLQSPSYQGAASNGDQPLTYPVLDPAPVIQASVSAPPPVEMSVGLPEALDFSITPQWVTAHWPRVSTAIGHTGLNGMRVAFVTGTNVGDLHGSLTFYFDKTQRLQRITFQGYTGDMRKIVALVTEKYGLHIERSMDAGLYVKSWNGIPRNVLWIGHAPVVDKQQEFSRFLVRLEMNRTDGAYELSREFKDFLIGRRYVGRW